MEKFLTVYAVFDTYFQNQLLKIRNTLSANNLIGTQTNDIPFHISIGSFPISEKDNLIELINHTCQNFKDFDINFSGINNFNNKVLFLEPKKNDDIFLLRQIFNNDYPNQNKHPFTPHCTILIDEEENITKATKICNELEQVSTGKIVALELGEFFPTKILHTMKLCGVKEHKNGN